MIILVVALAVIQGFMIKRTVLRSPASQFGEDAMAAYTADRITRADILGMAEGAVRGDGSLVEQLAALAESSDLSGSGDGELLATFTAAGGAVTDSWRVGRISPWFTAERTTLVRDVYTREQRQTHASLQRTDSSWWISSRVVGWSTTRMDGLAWTGSSTWVDVPRLLTVIATVLVIMWAARLLWAWARRGTRRAASCRDDRTVRTRSRGIGPAVFVMLFALISVWAYNAQTTRSAEAYLASAKPLLGGGNAWGAPRTSMARTGLWASEIAKLPATSEGDAAIARAIVAANPHRDDGEMSAAFGFLPPSIRTTSSATIGWPWPLVHINRSFVTYRDGYPEAGSRAPHSATQRRFAHAGEWILFARRPANPTDDVLSMHVWIPGLVATGLAWYALWRLFRIIHWFLWRRRRERRTARGECLPCGYPLAAIARATPHGGLVDTA